jgi:hypothetical protein
MLRSTSGIAVSIDSKVVRLSSTKDTLDLCTEVLDCQKSPPVYSHRGSRPNWSQWTVGRDRASYFLRYMLN